MGAQAFVHLMHIEKTVNPANKDGGTAFLDNVLPSLSSAKGSGEQEQSVLISNVSSSSTLKEQLLAIVGRTAMAII